MHTRTRRPRKQKQSHGKDNTATHHWRQSGFRHRLVAILFVLGEVVFVVENAKAACNDDANEHGEERQGAHDW